MQNPQVSCTESASFNIIYFYFLRYTRSAFICDFSFCQSSGIQRSRCFSRLVRMAVFFQNRSKGTILATITQRKRAFYLVSSDIICTFAGRFL